MLSEIVPCHEGMQIVVNFFLRQTFHIVFIFEPCLCLNFDLGYSSGQQSNLFSIGSQNDRTSHFLLCSRLL